MLGLIKTQPFLCFVIFLNLIAVISNALIMQHLLNVMAIGMGLAIIAIMLIVLIYGEEEQ